MQDAISRLSYDVTLIFVVNVSCILVYKEALLYKYCYEKRSIRRGAQELRQSLIKKIRENPKEAIKELERNPKILDLLLTSDVELQKKQEELRNEKVKYVNMTSHMQTQLRQQADKLKTTQGLLIGAGVLFLLSLLDEK